jgi:hypothetical protein
MELIVRFSASGLATAAMSLLLTTGPVEGQSNTEDPDGAVRWYSLASEEKHPKKFEPYLRENPEDGVRRSAALDWYGRKEKDVARLRHHTLEMVKHHPANFNIFFANSSLFFANPDFRVEVIRNLEEQVAAGHTQHGVYWNLALICKQAAIPPVGHDLEGKSRFLRKHGLPQDAELPTNIDTFLAGKAAQYFESAVAASKGDDFNIAFYSRQLAELFIELDRPKKAAAVCENVLPNVKGIAKANFLVTYGRCLLASGNIFQAKNVLVQVRPCDKEGFDGGPGHATASAETTLGLIAMEEGDIATAKGYLISSCNVQGCCHNSTIGLSLNLASQLFDEREYDAVAHYCREVLKKFTPEQEETKALLRRALEQKAKGNGE